jgi:hypothetical protein
MISRHMLQYNIAQVPGTSQDKFADSLIATCDVSYFTLDALAKLHKDPLHKEAREAISGEYNKIGSVNGSPIYRQKEGFELFLSRDLSDFAHTFFKSARPPIDHKHVHKNMQEQQHVESLPIVARILINFVWGGLCIFEGLMSEI